MTAIAESQPSSRSFDQERQNRSGLLIISRTTIDRTPQQMIPLPHELAHYRAGDKVPQTRDEFDSLHSTLQRQGVIFEPTVGGNGTNIGHRISEYYGGTLPVTVLTWGNSQYKDLLRRDLNHPYKQMSPRIESIEGDMPEALVFSVRTPNGIDRIIAGTSPQMPSAFAHAIDTQEHVILNSLGEPDWRKSLNEGIDKLRKSEIPFTYTPGSAQLRAVRRNDDPSAVYYAIKNTSSLVVNVDELRELVGPQASDNAKVLLQQGLALGPQTIFATFGANGAYAADQEGTMLMVSATNTGQELISTLGAGDAFLAGTYPEGNLEDKARLGSASAAHAIITIGAHDNPPTNTQLEATLKEYPADIVYLSQHPTGNRKYILPE